MIAQESCEKHGLPCEAVWEASKPDAIAVSRLRVRQNSSARQHHLLQQVFPAEEEARSQFGTKKVTAAAALSRASNACALVASMRLSPNGSACRWMRKMKHMSCVSPASPAGRVG
jgi:hypothetical protein